jgi:hypothetical protein
MENLTVKTEKMEGFNKYQFLENLKTTIIDLIKEGFLNDIDELQTEIDNEIERATIYNSDCFDIAKELHLTFFTGFRDGNATTISELACFGLDEYVCENFNFNEIEILIEENNK